MALKDSLGKSLHFNAIRQGRGTTMRHEAGRTTHEIVNALDPLRMWTTLISMTDNAFQSEDRGEYEEECHSGVALPYDPRLVLCCLAEAAKPANVGFLNLRAFIMRNCLSFAFAATSLPCAELRRLAYTVISRFHKHLGRERDVPDAERRKIPADGLKEERPLYAFAIRLFRDSVHESGQRVSRVVAHFFARLCKLMLAPADPCFAPLMAFLALKPRMRLDTVPEFLKFFHSSSTENHRAERQWVLKLCVESTREPRDYQVLCKVYAIESCMSLFTSPVADLKSKLLILRLFEQCAAIPSSARDMHHRLSFDTWLTQAVEFSRTTQFEELRLAAIFAKLVENIYGRDGAGMSSEETPPAKRAKRQVENEGREWEGIDKLTLRTNAERILARLNKISSADGGDERSLCVKRLKRLRKRVLGTN